MTPRSVVRSLVVAGTVLLTCGGVARAQSGTAALRGRVVDAQGAVVPGATVTLASDATGLMRETVTDAAGDFVFVSLPPGTYSLRVSLQGFRTAVFNGVPLPVDTVARQDVRLEIGEISEAIEVTAFTTVINTTDASMGHVITGSQIRALPLEARNVVGLLSLQPGAVYLPNTVLFDNRSGAVSGARADQTNITLDGVDVNDPQFNIAYTSALRTTLDSLQEFRVTTSNYGADMGRSSSAQVSLVTRSGTNDYRGSGYYVVRRTATSANEYFNKLAGLEVPKLDKQIYGGSFGGALIKDTLFFFGNYERLTEDSEAAVTRSVPSTAMRDGVLIYQCADAAQCSGGTVRGFSNTHTIPAGFYGATPADLASVDPLGIGPSRAAADYWKVFPLPNDPGLDGHNLMGYRFTAPYTNTFNTTIGRLDYRPHPSQSMFGRVNIQRDDQRSVPQFLDLGLPPNVTAETRSWGAAVGWDWVLSSSLVNTLRYGFTTLVYDEIGTLNAAQNYFGGLDHLNQGYPSDGREMATHNFVNDMTWVKGAHTVKFGTNLRFTRIPSYHNFLSYNEALANGSWVDGSGRTYIPGRGSCTTPGCSQLPAAASSFYASWATAWTDILGVMSLATAHINYDRDGNPLPEGEPARRRYASDEYEFYVQDSWTLGAQVTLTGGVRYSLASPPYETNGLQVAPDVSLGAWFKTRQQMGKDGIPDNTLPLVSYVLSGPKNGKTGYYDWDTNNWAPRVSLAWTPSDDWVVRGGYSLVYDRMGLALAGFFDAFGSYGLSTSVSSPFGVNNETTPEVRFQGINILPPTVPAAPKGGFPATPEVDRFTTAVSIDDTLTTPYAHTVNAVVGRTLAGSFSIEAGYVGRLGRNLLMRRDLAMPLNLVDQESGTDYYTAATAVITQLEQNGFDPGSVTPVAYFENLFPGAAFGGQTATQNIAATYAYYYPDHTSALAALDFYCDPACTVFGPYSYFNGQFFSMAGQSTIARADYHALQLSLRKRYSDGYQFDLNYTLGHSQDHGSTIERADSYSGGFVNGGQTGFLVNSWDPDQQYAHSDFDIRHQLNANWVVELPVGRGKRLGKEMPSLLDAIVGNWSVAGLLRWTSGLPFNVRNCGSCWPTNWQAPANASLKEPGRLPPTGTTKNVLNGKPSPFAVSPEEALAYFRFDYPGEGGIRNQLRGDGYFSIDLSLAKSWLMPWGRDHRVWFRWDTFNLTNTPRFDVGNLVMVPDITTTFGTYNGTYATCDGNAGRCMQFSLRYEF